MLSMKTLRVAIVTMGTALMLGPGLAAAIDLDGTGAMAPSPRVIATQTIPSGTGNVTPVAGGTAMYHNITIDDAAYLWEITPRVRLVDGYFLRVALGGGMIFRGTLAATAGGNSVPDTERVAGGEGHNYVVYELPAVALSTDAANPNKISVQVNDSLAVANTMAGDYTASMTIHEKQFDAIDGVAPFRSLGATDVTVVRAVSGVDARITPTNHVANVGAGFRWFVNPDSMARAATPNVSKVAFGTVNAMAKSGAGAVINAGGGSEDSTAGAEVTDADLIGAMGVTFGVEGDFSVGVFDIIPTTMPDTSDTADEGDRVARDCPSYGGSAGAPTMADAGNLKPNEDDANMRMLADQAPGAYKLCMEVDLAGAMSNTSPIPVTDYVVTVYTRSEGQEARDNVMANEGSIGKITRNGASVKIAFLTNAEKYNQRLIIVNHGTRDIAITDAAFNVEADVEVEVMSSADDLMIAAGERKVYLVKDMLSIMGRNRVAGTLSFSGVAGNISVATTLVNREDGSTDTVMWPVN